MRSHWVLTLLYLNNVLYWPEDDRLRSKHVAIMWPECLYNITLLIYSYVLTEYNKLYKFTWTAQYFSPIVTKIEFTRQTFMKSPVTYFTEVLQVVITLIHTYVQTNGHEFNRRFSHRFNYVIYVHSEQSNYTLVRNLAQMIPIPTRTPIKSP